MGVIARAVLACVMCVATTAAAQQPDREQRSPEARELFARGEIAFAEGRLADARRLFRRSLDLHPHPATAFNLALALREAGAYRESSALYDELLDGRYGELDEDRRREVDRLRAEAAERIGHVSVVVRGAPTIELLVDGRVVARARSGSTAEAEVDPGEHVLTARATGFAPIDETVHVEAGETVRRELALAEPVEARTRADAAGQPDGAAPWIWIVLAGVLVIGGVTAIAILARSDEEALPSDLVLGRAVTLRW